MSAVVIVLTTRAGWLVGPSMRHSRALVHVVRLHGRCRCQPARHAHSTLELKHVHRRGAGGGGGGGLRPPSRPPPSADVPGAPVAPAAASAPGAGCDRHACHGCTIMSSASNSSIAAWTLGNMARARLATHGLALTKKPITLHNCPPVHFRERRRDRFREGKQRLYFYEGQKFGLFRPVCGTASCHLKLLGRTPSRNWNSGVETSFACPDFFLTFTRLLEEWGFLIRKTRHAREGHEGQKFGLFRVLGAGAQRCLRLQHGRRLRRRHRRARLRSCPPAARCLLRPAATGGSARAATSGYLMLPRAGSPCRSSSRAYASRWRCWRSCSSTRCSSSRSSRWTTPRSRSCSGRAAPTSRPCTTPSLRWTCASWSSSRSRSWSSSTDLAPPTYATSSTSSTPPSSSAPSSSPWSPST